MDGLAVRPDERDARFGQLRREHSVLREKPVARVHSLRACTHTAHVTHGSGRVALYTGWGGKAHRRKRTRLVHRVQDLVHAQVALLRRCVPDAHRLVCQLHVLRERVDLRVHRHRLDSQAPACLNHSAGDLAAVSNEHFGEPLQGNPKEIVKVVPQKQL